MQFRTDWRKIRMDLFRWYEQQALTAIATNDLQRAQFYSQMMKVSIALDRIEFQPPPQRKQFGVSKAMDGIIYGSIIY